MGGGGDQDPYMKGAFSWPTVTAPGEYSHESGMLDGERDSMITPIALQAPVVVTEMDWAPKKYESSWGKATTGEAGGKGFGANFIRIADETCNVSWLLFTDGNLLASYDDKAPDGNTFLTDPEACPRPVFRKYQIYATKEYSDMINKPDY